jgi:hypothetical protein
MEDIHLSMNLSSLFTAVPDYAEYAWVTAPNTAADTITNDTVTTLRLTNEIQDAAGFGTLASNQVTLAAGTYLYKLLVPVVASSGRNTAVAGLYNVTDSSWISRNKAPSEIATGSLVINEGQFVIASSKAVDCRIFVTSNTAGSIRVTNAAADQYSQQDFTLSTAGVDQRTTLKLWKLK